MSTARCFFARLWVGCVAAALWPAGSPALAQTPADTPQEQAARAPSFFDDLWTRDSMLGRSAVGEEWRDRGIQVDAFYNAYLGWNADGGRNTGDARSYSHSFDLFVRADTEQMGLWSGGSALLQVKNNAGENVNPDAGALSQVVDDADFDAFFYIDQLYYEHAWREHKVRLRAGYLDYQTIVDRNAYANSEDVRFMNAALDNNLLVPLKIGFGAALFLEPRDGWELILGTADADNEIRKAGFDTAFEDTENLMAYAEVAYQAELESARGGLRGTYRWGVYYDPRTVPVYDEMRETDGTVGTWLSFDQLVYRESEADDQGLGLFYRYGYREEESYAISQLHSGGLEYRGLLPRREADAAGIGFYDLVSSDDYEEAVDPDFHGETGFEAYYRVQVSPWLAITPGVQYVEDPGGLDSDRDALVFVLRTRFKF